MVSWEKMFENYDKRLDLDDINEFQSHLNNAVDHKIKKLEAEYDTVTQENFADPDDLIPYKEHLNDVMMSVYSAKVLGYELSIIALYKKVEIKTKKIIEARVPNPKAKNLSYFNNLCDVLPFDIKFVNGYESFNELRLINNSIKHGGYVSSELATSYPDWKEEDELKDLEKAYERLLPGVESYVYDLVSKIYEIPKS
ncbi:MULTISPECIES: hypothetical protein [Shewanella]|uniref:hypothetical protein n=1 Tax=Shewanella TaxID=22 RepID=UPI00300744EC